MYEFPNNSKNLFFDGFETNISLGENNVDNSRLRTIIQDLRLNEFISNLPNGLETQLGERGINISGGQRQRIAIARSIILKPKFIILDEPTSALDRSIQIQIIDLLKSLQEKYSLTYLFISHDLKVIRAMSDRILVMQNGEMVEEGNAKSIFEKPKEEYTRELLSAAIKYS